MEPSKPFISISLSRLCELDEEGQARGITSPSKIHAEESLAKSSVETGVQEGFLPRWKEVIIKHNL